jgi:uncharacterized protein YjcR
MSWVEMKKMSERVDNLSMKYLEKEQECNALRKEVEVMKEKNERERVMHIDEVESLKE